MSIIEDDVNRFFAALDIVVQYTTSIFVFQFDKQRPLSNCATDKCLKLLDISKNLQQNLFPKYADIIIVSEAFIDDLAIQLLKKRKA